ncbi:hypothetical protein [Avibacterium paragallinarum]|uniref:Uncharacterized protein n=1 Tax=Avibacterium paragallinarum TaxID=728 RepID=A0ABU7QSZ4_AVIPA|nr:hypothetical protein [Avibacterium paragallinarum]
MNIIIASILTIISIWFAVRTARSFIEYIDYRRSIKIHNKIKSLLSEVDKIEFKHKKNEHNIEEYYIKTYRTPIYIIVYNILILAVIILSTPIFFKLISDIITQSETPYQIIAASTITSIIGLLITIKEIILRK